MVAAHVMGLFLLSVLIVVVILWCLHVEGEDVALRRGSRHGYGGYEQKAWMSEV